MSLAPSGAQIAPPPFDITGLSTSTYESSAPVPGPYTQVSFSVMSDPFGTELLDQLGVGVTTTTRRGSFD